MGELLVQGIDHVTDGVYISGWRAFLFRDELLAAGIRHVLKLYEDTPRWPAEFETLDHPLPDGVFIPLETLKRGAAFIREQVDAGRPVLVLCGAGMSRSSTFVLAYLLERGYTLREAFDLLKRQHPIAQPHIELWRSLIVHYQLEDTLRDVIFWGHNAGE